MWSCGKGLSVVDHCRGNKFPVPLLTAPVAPQSHPRLNWLTVSAEIEVSSINVVSCGCKCECLRGVPGIFWRISTPEDAASA